LRYLLCALAFSFGVASAEITPNMLNTVNDGASIKGGTYFNTAGHDTLFTNSAKTGITLDAGQNIRGAEAFNGAVTGNGGNIHIQAPDQVVRLNGNIDVRGFLPKNAPGIPGYMLPGSSFNGEYNNPGPGGNGGNVTIDAAYLFQNGNIYAGGYNGGHVQFNVGNMTMGPTSRIDATGGSWQWSPADDNSQMYTSHGNGGTVNVHSNGDVSISKGAYITTAGEPNYDNTSAISNNIAIVGNAVNMDGVLYAGRAQYGGGKISLVANGPSGDVNISKGAILQTEGGAITISSQHDINQSGLILATGPSTSILNSGDGFMAGGGLGQPGGAVTLTSSNVINNTGRIQSDGGNSGGGYPLGADILDKSTIPYTGIQPPGFAGGNGGVITVTAPSISNTGVIRAMGGAGVMQMHSDPAVVSGNAIFSGNAGGNGGQVNFSSNPTGNGNVATFQGQGASTDYLKLFGASAPTIGTITAPNPAASTNTLIGVWKKNPI
jgi:hypothetical protein